MNPIETAQPRGRRLAAVTAITGTVFIAAGAFWLSFTALADLAAQFANVHGLQQRDAGGSGCGGTGNSGGNDSGGGGDGSDGGGCGGCGGGD